MRLTVKGLSATRQESWGTGATRTERRRHMPTDGSRRRELHPRMTPAVKGDDQEAEEREEEGEVDCGHGADKAHVDDAGLERWHDGAAEDGHDEAGGADLRIFTADAFKGDAIDSREHERHAG